MSAADYEVLQPATRREVVDAFLKVELGKPVSADLLKGLGFRDGLSDSEFFAVVRKFADARSDTNPFLVFTVGVRGNEGFRNIKTWVRARCRIDAIYTLGINPKMKPDLSAVGWNLQKFSAIADKYPEFELHRVPEGPTKSMVFGLVMSRPEALGTIALIDGSHRVVCMAAHRVETVEAYLGMF